MEKKIIYRDYLLQEFCWWSYNDRGKQEFMTIRAAQVAIGNGEAILVDTPEAEARLKEIYKVRG
jgi:hypothetical protein